MKAWISDIELSGKYVQLLPMQLSDREGLLKAAADGELWKLWYTSVPSAKTIDSYISRALTERNEHKAYPFKVVDRQSNQIIGSTRYLNLEAEHRRLEIGNTWYARSFQRTGVNTECKYLLLRYAFESLNCIAVEFRTHWHNHRSRNAILRLGAKQDGVLRNHRLIADGTLRDTVVFSIIDQEWTSVKKGLESKLGEYQ